MNKLVLALSLGGASLSPFSFGQVNTPVTIQAEAYSYMSGVALENTTDIGGGQNVGWIDNNDWLAFTNNPVNISTAGNYIIEYRVASLNGGGSLVFEESGGNPSYGSITVPRTDGWQKWQTIKHTVVLSAGVHRFGLKAVTGGFNINWFSVSPAQTSSSSQSSISSASSASSVVSSSSSSVPSGLQCNWWGTLYPACVTTTAGWGYENGSACVAVSTCNSQPAPYGIVGSSSSSKSSSSIATSSSVASSSSIKSSSSSVISSSLASSSKSSASSVLSSSSKSSASSLVSSSSVLSSSSKSSSSSVLSSSSKSSSSSLSSSANILPVAYNDIVLTAQGQAVAFDYLTVNDTDADGAVSDLTILSVTSPAHGVLTKLTGNNNYRYQPDASFTGEDSFSYTVADKAGGQSTAKVTIAVNATINATAVKNSLLSGVSALSYSPTRGHMIAFGPTTINLGNYKDKQTPMAVASTLGAGRVVALPGLHWASLDNPDNSNKADIEQFFLNSLAWLGKTTSKNIRIVHNTHVEIASWLKSKGFTNVTTTDNYVSNLANTDVLIVWLGGSPTETQINSVTQFIQNGGSVLLVEFGDGFKEYTGWWPTSLPNNGGNRVLRKAGVAFGTGWNYTSAPLTLVDGKPLLESDLVNVLKTPTAYTEDDKARIGESLQHAFAALPPHDTLLARLDQNFTAIVNTISPTPSTPSSNAFEHSLLKREVQLLDKLPVKDIRAHRTAEAVYGKIPAGAVRFRNQQVTINGNWTGMLATGMYAAPGEVVNVTVPSALIGKGYYIRLSGHSDNIGEDNDTWKRMPSGIQRSFPINTATTAVATPYGGAIYIDLLDGADGQARRTYGDLNVTIDGAIKAPYFVLGKNTNQEWLDTIRNYPAPFAEFVTDNVAVSVPSSMIKNITDPEALLSYWNQYVGFQDWVGGTEKYRTGPDRINFDVQISVGYLHAGYPIQGPSDVESSIDFLDLAVLRNSGEWGYFHEMGHEMQDQGHLWSGGYEGNGFTFSGDVEVTVNIFANAALEKMAPLCPKYDWGYSVYHNEVLLRSKQTINDTSKPKFDNKDPYPFYFALADGFGWETYRKVLSGYVDDSLANSPAYPKTNQDKKDQWLIRWSKITGYNLVEYMVNRWKLEVTPSAIATVNNMGLPNWLPATTSVEHFKIAQNGSKTLNFKNTGLTLNGTATFVRVVAGQNGTLTLNGDGTYTYRAKAGFVGVDQFKVVYRSEVGNEVETVISVQVGG